MDALKDILVDIDYEAAPAFAVLDGAQFDDLPMELLMGDFIGRSLYLDRGDNDPEQVITAPHLVLIDETTENPDGRAPAEVIDALAELVGDKAAVVFWQCEGGADALFKHLRGLNMVRLPKSALLATDRASVVEDTAPALFRHADANVMAQVMVSLNRREAVRLFGPTQGIYFMGDAHWRPDRDYFHFAPSEDWPAAEPGMLEFSEKSISRLERAREAGMRRWAMLDFAEDTPDIEGQIDEAYTRAESYGLETKEDIWMFIDLDLKHGAGFESKPGYDEVLDALTNQNDSPELRIEYAADACAELQEGVAS